MESDQKNLCSKDNAILSTIDAQCAVRNWAIFKFGASWNALCSNGNVNLSTTGAQNAV